MTSLQTIGVIGAGTMGADIAQAWALAGLSGSIEQRPAGGNTQL